MNQVVFDGESLITAEAMADAIGSLDTRVDARELEEGKAELALILGLARQQFEQGGNGVATLERVNDDLHRLRTKLSPSAWQQLVPVAQNHPVAEFFLQDPFTRWSFEKPRGYSGDARLLDFIYGHPSVSEAIESASPLGLELYGRTRNSFSSQAVRERRDLLTREVDGIAAARGGEVDILAVAGGHLREAEQSIALKAGDIRRWVALDQDPMSIGTIARDYGGTIIEPIDGSVRGLLTDRHDLGRFDMVYAAGLYDYLTLKVAAKLTRKCMDMLKPGGTFLFANFSPEMVDDGFMETFMAWPLQLRSEQDMWDIVNASVDRNAVVAETFFGENRNIVYTTITLKA